MHRLAETATDERPQVDGGFVCEVDASGEEGVFADPCAGEGDCDPGLLCADAAGVLPDAAPISAISKIRRAARAAMGREGASKCVSAFEVGTAPPQWAHVGICLIPA
jgi:hypothetical protein